ncbi:MAG TPA: hypothetical protein V6D05_07370, partial [Stenomitos sp.]
MPPRFYRIRVSPELGPSWSARFEDLTLRSTPGLTELSGLLADQAALHGILTRIRDLGLTLVSLESHDAPPSPPVVTECGVTDDSSPVRLGPGAQHGGD